MSRHRITLLMTRPEAGSRAFVAALPDVVTQSCDVLMSPLIDIQPVTADVPEFDAAIFTSAHGVAHGPQALGRPAFCLGHATTRAAGQAGWQARQVGQDAETLVTALTAQHPAGRMVHFSGTHTRGDVADRLQAVGLAVGCVAVYDQVLLPLSDAAQNRLKETDPVIVPLFSPRSALHFSEGAQFTAPLYLGAISAAAAANCAHVEHVALQIAGNPDRGAMIEVVRKLLTRALSA